MTKRREPSAVAVPRFEALARAEWAAAIALTALTLAAHVVFLLHAGPLWRDEANTVAVATKPTLGALIGALEHESFPALPFAAVRAWSLLGLGATDLRLRLLGFLVGLGILAAVWWNRTRTRGGLPLLALALCALNPVVLRWGDSLRGYGIGALFGIVAFGCIYRLAVEPSLRSAAIAACASVLAVQCVYQNALLLAAMFAAAAVVALVHRNFAAIRLCVAAGAVALASLLPYLPIVGRAREHFVVITLDADFARIWRAFLEALGREGAAAGSIAAWTLIAIWFLAFAAALIAAGWAWGKPRADLALYGGVVALVAPLLFFVFVYRLRFLTEPWYFIVLLAAQALAIEGALTARGHQPAVRIAKLVIAAAVAAVTIAATYPSLQARKTNINRIAATLERQAAANDLIVLNPWFYGVSFGRYYHGATPWTLVPPLSDREIHRFDLVKEMMTKPDPLAPLFAQMAETLRGGHRVYVVGGLSAPPQGRPPRKLPPAPGAGGWYSAPYLGAWSQEVGYFLQAHAERGGPVRETAAGPVSAYENLPLIAVEGWKAER